MLDPQTCLQSLLPKNYFQSNLIFAFDFLLIILNAKFLFDFADLESKNGINKLIL